LKQFFASTEIAYPESEISAQVNSVFPMVSACPEDIGVSRTAIDGTIGETVHSGSAHISRRERNAYLNIIGALNELVQSPRDKREGDAAVIRELVDNYSDKYGISKSNLEKQFAAAKRSLQAD